MSDSTNDAAPEPQDPHAADLPDSTQAAPVAEAGRRAKGMPAWGWAGISAVAAVVLYAAGLGTGLVIAPVGGHDGPRELARVGAELPQGGDRHGREGADGDRDAHDRPHGVRSGPGERSGPGAGERDGAPDAPRAPMPQTPPAE